jgi:excisionase family DNA binding protein
MQTHPTHSIPARKPLYSVRETAEIHGVHENTIWNWIKAGEIKSLKRGKRRYIFGSEIWIKGDAA